MKNPNELNNIELILKLKETDEKILKYISQLSLEHYEDKVLELGILYLNHSLYIQEFLKRKSSEILNEYPRS